MFDGFPGPLVVIKTETIRTLCFPFFNNLILWNNIQRLATKLWKSIIWISFFSIVTQESLTNKTVKVQITQVSCKVWSSHKSLDSLAVSPWRKYYANPTYHRTKARVPFVTIFPLLQHLHFWLISGTIPFAHKAIVIGIIKYRAHTLTRSSWTSEKVVLLGTTRNTFHALPYIRSELLLRKRKFQRTLPEKNVQFFGESKLGMFSDTKIHKYNNTKI